MIQYSFFITIVLLLCCFASSQDFFPDYGEDNPLPHPPHERIRRFIRFSSRKPGLEADTEKGIGFKGHLKNLLKGGTLGMEFYIPHVNRFGKHFPYWKELLGNKGKKNEEKDKKDEEDEFADKDADDEDDFDNKDADDEEDVELSDEGYNGIESDKREENELDYVRFINPRVKENEP